MEGVPAYMAYIGIENIRTKEDAIEAVLHIINHYYAKTQVISYPPVAKIIQEKQKQLEEIKDFVYNSIDKIKAKSAKATIKYLAEAIDKRYSNYSVASDIVGDIWALYNSLS